MDRTELAKRIREAAYLEGDFTLRSGRHDAEIKSALTDDFDAGHLLRQPPGDVGDHVLGRDPPSNRERPEPSVSTGKPLVVDGPCDRRAHRHGKHQE